MENGARKIVDTLRNNGYIAYYAGGWVRDFLMGHPSSDVDIATDATPDDVERLFEKTHPVGKAFGVMIVTMHGHPYEVATFRTDEGYTDGRRPTSIVHSTPKEDALRRDFTINGIFYDPVDEKVYDFVGGQEDLKRGVIRAIGNPFDRFSEDRLRTLRAVRFGVRFGFTIDHKTEEGIIAFADKIYPAVAKERVWQEIKRMGEFPSYPEALILLKKLGLLDTIFWPAKKLSLKEIEEKLIPLKKAVHPILPLALLFYGEGQEALLTLFKELKVSNDDLSALTYGLDFIQFLKSGHSDPIMWVELLASPLSDDIAMILAGENLLIKKEQERLKHHIERKRQKRGIITAQELIDRGAKPGKEIGELLRRAEEIAITEDLLDKGEVLRRLENL